MRQESVTTTETSTQNHVLSSKAAPKQNSGLRFYGLHSCIFCFFYAAVVASTASHLYSYNSTAATGMQTADGLRRQLNETRHFGRNEHVIVLKP